MNSLVSSDYKYISLLDNTGLIETDAIIRELPDSKFRTRSIGVKLPITSITNDSSIAIDTIRQHTTATINEIANNSSVDIELVVVYGYVVAIKADPLTFEHTADLILLYNFDGEIYYPEESTDL